jgi:TonB family protein
MKKASIINHFKIKIISLLSLSYLISYGCLAQHDSTTVIVTQKRLLVDVESLNKQLYSKPWFATGDFSWRDFIKQHMKYPARAKRKNIQGSVKVKFLVTKNGKIRMLRIIGKRLGHGLEREAKRIVKLSEGGWWIIEENGKAKSKTTEAYVTFTLL